MGGGRPETPYLSATITAALALCRSMPDGASARTPLGVGALAGVALAPRHDAVFLVAPLVAFAAARATRRARLGVMLPAALPLAAWLSVSWATHGAALPTLFYVKLRAACGSRTTRCTRGHSRSRGWAGRSCPRSSGPARPPARLFF